MFARMPSMQCNEHAQAKPTNMPATPQKQQIATVTLENVAALWQYRFSWKLKFKFWFWFLGHFLSKVGPRTPLFGSGSKNGAERTQHQPRGPILMSFRDSFVVRS